MPPKLQHIGESRSPLVTVDGFSGAVDRLVELAAAMAPFPGSRGNYYPGVRRVIGPADEAAHGEVVRLVRHAAPLIGGAFDVDQFDLLEASFSMVTAPADSLAPAQRAPHFDSTDPLYLALLLYLSDTQGTAFYRQRSTGIERIDDGNRQRFFAAAQAEGAGLSGYIRDSGPQFERIAAVEGVADRLAIYQGCVLHSGIIPADIDLSADPRRGRLTLNIFVQGHRT
jgi:hypothetical protein